MQDSKTLQSKLWSKPASEACLAAPCNNVPTTRQQARCDAHRGCHRKRMRHTVCGVHALIRPHIAIFVVKNGQRHILQGTPTVRHQGVGHSQRKSHRRIAREHHPHAESVARETSSHHSSHASLLTRITPHTHHSSHASLLTRTTKAQQFAP